VGRGGVESGCRERERERLASPFPGSLEDALFRVVGGVSWH